MEDSTEHKLLCQRMYAAAFDHFWWVLLSNRRVSWIGAVLVPVNMLPPLFSSSFDPMWPSQSETELREDISHLIGFFSDLKKLPDGNGREGKLNLM